MKVVDVALWVAIGVCLYVHAFGVGGIVVVDVGAGGGYGVA